ncbi:hypothetical protein [Nocardia blacklockiae]|uniref:hypothetical protein n=1 Tax=Nocardia blacklockiae TaxID=480036 RepID=UPI0018958B79|nr:hypothetical protein [Nocardia blacklockiae]MBF6171011.1 hypothetical protein [Nocardia blacklockiae]
MHDERDDGVVDRGIARGLPEFAPVGWRRLEASFAMTIVCESVLLLADVGTRKVRCRVSDTVLDAVRQHRSGSAQTSDGPWWRLLVRMDVDVDGIEIVPDYGTEPFPGEQLFAPDAYRADLEVYPRDRLPVWLAAYIGRADLPSRPPRQAAEEVRADRAAGVRAVPARHDELPDLGVLWARWAVLAAAFVAAGSLRGPRVGASMGVFESAERSGSTLTLLPGDRAVLSGGVWGAAVLDAFYNAGAAAPKLFAGAPSWVADPILNPRAATGLLSFCYWWNEGRWYRGEAAPPDYARAVPRVWTVDAVVDVIGKLKSGLGGEPRAAEAMVFAAQSRSVTRATIAAVFGDGEQADIDGALFQFTIAGLVADAIPEADALAVVREHIHRRGYDTIGYRLSTLRADRVDAGWVVNAPAARRERSRLESCSFLCRRRRCGGAFDVVGAAVGVGEQGRAAVSIAPRRPGLMGGGVSDELRIDTDTLRRDGARLAELGDRVGRTYAGLRDSLASVYGCWGDDDLGIAFAKDFTPQADRLLEDLHAMEESLHGTARQVDAAAQDFEAQDLAGGNQIGAAGSESFSPDRSSGKDVQPTPVAAPARTEQVVSTPTRSPGAVGGLQNGNPDSKHAGTSERASSVPKGDHPVPDRAPSADRASGAPAGSSAPKDVTPPTSETPDRPGSQQPAADPRGRTEPPRVTSPTAARREVPRSPGTTKPTRPAQEPMRPSGPVAMGKGGTPWSRPQAQGSSRPETPGTSPSGPRSGTPPRSPIGNPKRRNQRPDAEGPGDKRAASPVFAWLARTLRDQHDVVVLGFDLPDLQETPVREFAASVDRVLTEYPMIELDVVAVADEAGDVRWRSEPRESATVRSITLNRHAACEPDSSSAMAESDAGVDDSSIRSATVRELGRALDDVGGGVVGRTAQHIMIAEYMREMAGRYTTFGGLVGGYRRWRAELTGAADPVGRFEVDRAVGAAFADVVLNGNRACAAAKSLHTALIRATAPE